LKSGHRDSAGREDGRADTPGWHAVIAPGQHDFWGDDDPRIKEMQSESYPFLVSALYEAAREQVLAALTPIQVETGIVEKARTTAELDQPLLRQTYRRIAAQFRFACHRGPQLHLPFEDISHDDRLRATWEEYFLREVQALTRDPEISRAIVSVVSPEEPAAARAAEAHLVDLLDHRYGRFSLDRRLELLGDEADPAELEAWPRAEGPDWDDVLRPLPEPGDDDNKLAY
jgi:hypothetical protein